MRNDGTEITTELPEVCSTGVHKISTDVKRKQSHDTDARISREVYDLEVTCSNKANFDLIKPNGNLRKAEEFTVATLGKEERKLTLV